MCIYMYKNIGGIVGFCICSTVKPVLSGHSEEVGKGAKIRNRYNQVPHLTQDTNGEVTHSRHHKRESRGQPFPSR